MTELSGLQDDRVIENGISVKGGTVAVKNQLQELW
jgi:hypothetical protein